MEMGKPKSGKIASIELDFASETDASDSDDQSQEAKKIKAGVLSGPTIHQCARYNDLENLKLHISEGTTIANKRDKNGMSPLHYAARYNHREAVILLIRKGKADPMITDHDNATPLHYIARKKQIQENKDTEEVVKFLADCADVNAKDKYLSTALHFAAIRGNVVVARILLKRRDILVNAKDALGCTPLHDAATYGHTEVAELLLNHGARILQTDKDKCTALHLAALEGRPDILRLLINKADNRLRNQFINMTDDEQMTALHYAIESRSTECVELLLQHNALSNAPCRLKSAGSSPLHLAAIEDVPEIGKLLIAHGADICARDNHQATPLHQAAEYMAVSMIKVLLSNININVEVRDNEGYTPLLSAACYPCTEIVELLLEENASTEQTEQTERNIIHLAVKWQQDTILKKVIEHLRSNKNLQMMLNEHDKFGETPLHIAAFVGNLNIFKILLDSCADIYKKNEDEETSMLIAVKRGHFQLVSELLERSEKVLNDEDEYSNSALHLASQFGHLRIVRLLCEYGADTAYRNNKHRCPVDVAAENGNLEIVQYFIEDGAEIESEDKDMETPLQLASSNGHSEIVSFLLNQGADVARPNRNGQTSLEMAIYKGHRSVAETIMTSSRWKEALAHESKYKDGKDRHTPLRLLITKMPDVAHKTLNNFLEVDSMDENPDEEFIRCHFTFLDDTDTDYKHELNQIADREMNTPSRRERYTSDYVWIKENHPLLKMVNAKQSRLLHHPVTLALIRHKWNVAQKFYIVFVLFYALLLATYTTLMMKAIPPHKDRICSEVENNSADEALKVCVYVLSIAGIFIEVVQVLSKLLGYFMEPANYLTVFCYIAAIITVSNTPNNCYQTSEKWKWELAAFTLLSLWLNFLLLLRRVPAFGVYVVMLTEIMKTFLRLAVIFSLFIVAFGLSFYMLLEPQEYFSSPEKSIMKTFIMMLGELEYTSIFFPENDALLPYSAVTYVIFILFLIVMAIILMNLLVGLAVEDVSELRRNAIVTTLAMQVNLALDVEMSLPRSIQQFLQLNQKTVDIHIKESKNVFIRLYISSKRIIDGALLSEKSIFDSAKSLVDDNNTVTEAEQENSCQCAEQLQKLTTKIDNLVMSLKSH